MFPDADQILTSLTGLESLIYAGTGLAALLEGWFVTGILIPGALIVDVGGVLAQQGLVSLWWLGLWVVLGSVLGGELGYWTGRLARQGLRGRLETSRSYGRASAAFDRHGGLALVLGRFLGPSGLVPLAAAIAGMPHRRFLLWSVLAAIPYAVFHLGLGYLLGDAFTRLGPLASRFALALLALALVVGGLIWLVTRALLLMPFVLAVTRSALLALGAMPLVRRRIARHPRLAGFVARRLDAGAFTGLPATVLAGVFVYVFGIWVGSVLDWLNAAPILVIDTRVANLMHAFWSPVALRVAAHVTALGDTRLVAALGGALAVWLFVRGRRGLAMGLALAVVGNALSVSALKLIFQRDRPPFAYFVESTNSFPSGHAAISVAFWSTLFYVLWRGGWLRLAPALVLAPLLALLIGGSRVYLGQHYLSDVFNGWLVGTLWAVAGIAVSEWWRGVHPRAASLGPLFQGAAGALAGMALLFSACVTVFYDKARSMPWTGPEAVIVASPEALVGHRRFESMASSIFGTPLAPVNVILQAADADTVARALQDAGWTVAERPDLGTAVRTAFRAWRSVEDPTAPLIAYFWAGAPDDLAFAKPNANADRRLSLRLWYTPYRTPEGLAVFLAAVSQGLGAPGPDAGRDLLVAGLVGQGAADLGRVDTGAPLRGRAISGSIWSSDGRAAVVWLP